MEEHDDAVHIDEDDARAAQTGTGMRWVLGIGLLLAIIAMSLIWIVPALSG